jgi:hypothetical protein
MRDDDRPKVGDAPADLCQTRLQLLVVARVSGIDERELAAVLDEEPVDPSAAEPVDAVRDALYARTLTAPGRPAKIRGTRT